MYFIMVLTDFSYVGYSPVSGPSMLPFGLQPKVWASVLPSIKSLQHWHCGIDGTVMPSLCNMKNRGRFKYDFSFVFLFNMFVF